MRTNIDLDDDLVAEARRYGRTRTKKELVYEALRELIRVRKRKPLPDLAGTVRFARGYDHKRLREER